MDFAKAFDKVSHNKLIYKLHSYGIEGDVLNWIKSFLSDRTQQVVVENPASNEVRYQFSLEYLKVRSWDLAYFFSSIMIYQIVFLLMCGCLLTILSYIAVLNHIMII